MDTSAVLPSEIWLQTFSYLGKGDLKSLRLSMDPHFGYLASSLLFTTAYVAARKGVLNTFLNLTTHPIYRTYVKEVVFDSSWIDPTIISEPPDDRDTERTWALFNEQEWIRLYELQARLEEAFQCLSNVKTVSYADLSRISCLPGDNNCDPVLGSDYADGSLIHRIEPFFLPYDYEINIQCLTSRTDVRCSLHSNHCQYRRRFGGLSPLLQALSNSACTTLQRLSLGSRVHACMNEGIPHWYLLSDTNVTTFHSFPNIFHGLRKLELNVTVFNLEASSRSAQLDPRNFCGGVADLLSLAENLEELTLIGDPKAATKLCVGRTLSTQEWARLRVVYLKWFAASVSELEDFLKRHTLSLRRLTLDEFNLTSGSWQHIGAIVPVINPALELILGLLSNHGRPFRAHAFLPLDSPDLDISGPSDEWYDKVKRNAEAEWEVDNENEDKAENENNSKGLEFGADEVENESDDSDTSEELEYSSDDSSSETDERRRTSDIALLDTIDADLRSKVEYLRNEHPGCPVQVCLRALDKCGDQNSARFYLCQAYGYTMLDTFIQGERELVVRLMQKLSFTCSVEQARDAIRNLDGDLDRALAYMEKVQKPR
ncbi:hypothetical protein BDR22DRAFT_829098 [Usnea florida]